MLSEAVWSALSWLIAAHEWHMGGLSVLQCIAPAISLRMHGGVCSLTHPVSAHRSADSDIGVVCCLPAGSGHTVCCAANAVLLPAPVDP